MDTRSETIAFLYFRGLWINSIVQHLCNFGVAIFAVQPGWLFVWIVATVVCDYGGKTDLQQLHWSHCSVSNLSTLLCLFTGNLKSFIFYFSLSFRSCLFVSLFGVLVLSQRENAGLGYKPPASGLFIYLFINFTT